jgi:hypothetical protein
LADEPRVVGISVCTEGVDVLKAPPPRAPLDLVAAAGDEPALIDR